MRVLLLFTRASIDNKQAYPESLRRLIEANSSGQLKVDAAVYDDLSYVLSSSHVDVYLEAAERSLREYDLVYLRRIKESTAQAIAIGKFCQSNDIAVIDDEIASRPGSMGKLTQYMQFALSGLPFPDTIYSADHSLLIRTLQKHPLAFPVILKSVSGSRGADNYLIASQRELEDTLAQHPQIHFLIQAYIPNSADYRVWVCGDSIGPILYRSRQSGHMNNTSQGGGATLLDATSGLSQNVLDDCVRAARLLKRDVAGVDVVFENDNKAGKYYFFEVNRAPQIEGTPYEDVKARALADYMVQQIKERQS